MTVTEMKRRCPCSISRSDLGVVASSPMLTDCVRKVAEDQGENIRVVMVRGLDEAIPIGKEMEQEGIEVIISRRGAASLLRENLRIPVLALPVTSLDILAAVKRATVYGSRILLPTFRQRLRGFEIIEEIFGIELVQGIYHNSASLGQLVQSAKEQDVDVVIGGGVTMKFAQKFDIPGVEIAISEEAVAFTIEDAKSVARSNREEQERTMRYRCILDSTSDGIVSVDQEGIITALNKAAKALLKIKQNSSEGEPIANCIHNPQILNTLQTHKAEFNRMEKINGNLFLTNHIPIMMGTEVVGGVSTFREISNVIKAENKVRRSFAKGLIAKYFIEDLIYQGPAMVEVIRKAKRYAASDSTILISGETGTGKEIIAQSIHNLTQRKKGPFVSINCAALPDQLLESELFGYEEGAFTGSRKGGKPGLFELAHKGTIFLDEIVSTPQSVQTRLLRVLQEREVMRISGDQLIPIDVRVIAAANKNLFDEVQSGRLREDLFFRLNVLTIHIPPLRERMEDLPPLIEALVKRISLKYKIKPVSIPAPYVSKLMQYPWPGNVRQLENFVERFVLLSEQEFSSNIFEEVFQELIDYRSTQREDGRTGMDSLKDYMQLKNQENESRIIWKTLEESNFCKSETAKKLGISRTTLWRKLKGWEKSVN